MSASPTARSLKECRKRGWEAYVVERYNMYARKKFDMFGCIDVVVLVPARDICDGLRWKPGILGIQATSGDNHAARRHKIADEPRMKLWLEAGGRLQIWSWAKQGARGKRKTWTLREEEITSAMFEQGKVAA